MRLVSDQSEADMRRRETREALVWPLRDLTANLLRITKGAGKPWELMKPARGMSRGIAAVRRSASFVAG